MHTPAPSNHWISPAEGVPRHARGRKSRKEGGLEMGRVFEAKETHGGTEREKRLASSSDITGTGSSDLKQGVNVGWCSACCIRAGGGKRKGEPSSLDSQKPLGGGTINHKGNTRD